MRTKDFGGLLAHAALALIPVTIATAALAQALPPTTPPAIAPTLVPGASVDLMTAEGAAALGAQWKTMEAKIVEGPALNGAQPGYKTSYDIAPHAGESGFDDSAWPTLEPKGLGNRLGGGKVSFIWYRTNLTIPEKIGGFDPKDAKAVLTAYVDDYAEVWVNGVLPRAAGRPSPATIQGFNMPNRLVLRDSVEVGERFEIAVFGINGPISAAPANFLWFREAKVEFFR